MPMELDEICFVPYVSYEGALLLSAYCSYDRSDYAGKQPMCIFREIVINHKLWDPAVPMLSPAILAKLKGTIAKVKIPKDVLKLAKKKGVELKKPKISVVRKRLKLALTSVSKGKTDCDRSQLLLNTIRLVVDYANKMEAPVNQDFQNLMSLSMMTSASANCLMSIGIKDAGPLQRPNTAYLYEEVYSLWDAMMKKTDFSPTEAQKIWSSLTALLLLAQDAPPVPPGPGDWRFP